ncbi:MAG TPA: ATP-binding protein [Candidatus Saccharimonadales bacterium]|nr:ATP-binding protein [Candidatus Saccharimonadales bacterium]
MKPRWMTLKWFFLLLAALLPVGLISLFALGIAYKSVRDLVRANNQAAVTTIAEIVSRDFGICMNLVRSFSTLPELVSAIQRNDPEAVRNELHLASETFPKFGRLYVADKEGHAWSSYPDEETGPSLNPQQREWVKLLNQKGQPVVSGVYHPGRFSKAGVVAMAVPVLDKAQKQIAILVCEYPMDEITARLRQLTPGGSGIVFLLDPNGVAAAHPRLFAQTRQHDEFLGLAPVQKALRGIPQSEEYVDPVTQSKMVGTFQPVSVRDRRWVVVAAQPVHEAYSTIQLAGLQIGSAAAVLAVMAMGIVTVLGRSNERNRELNLTLSQSNAELKRERFLIDTLMDTIPDHIYFKDLDSRFLRVNRAMATRFNLKDPAEAVGKSDSDFFAAEHARQAYQDEQEMIRTGNSLVNREEKETWPDGSVTWVSTTKICLRGKNGEIIGTFGLSRDITGRKEAEDALDRKAKELARSNKELEEFAYVASHDLQEPLRMIASYTQLLERRYKNKLDQDAHEFIAYAVDGATRMQVLINDLLAYSRVGTRGKPFAPTDCEEVMARTLSNLKIAIEESGAEITCTPLPKILGDTTQFTQLLQNLINNAIKFSRKDDKPKIHVGARLEKVPCSESGDQTTSWHFWVSDNGIGIDPKFFDRIFIIFQRLHTRDQYAGTGIGLSVCKKIVERHGGKIWVESEPEHGTTFHFTVPCSAQDVTAALK